jgi:hypothetical protein
MLPVGLTCIGADATIWVSTSGSQEHGAAVRAQNKKKKPVNRTVGLAGRALLVMVPAKVRECKTVTLCREGAAAGQTGPARAGKGPRQPTARARCEAGTERPAEVAARLKLERDLRDGRRKKLTMHI